MRCEKGQAMTEYVMISGLITAIAIAFLNYMQTPLRQSMQCVTEYVIGQALNPPFSGAGGFGGLTSALNCSTKGPGGN